MNKLSYALGLGIGQQLKSMGVENFAASDFAQAVQDVLDGNELAVSHTEAQRMVTEYFQKKEAEMEAETPRKVRRPRKPAKLF